MKKQVFSNFPLGKYLLIMLILVILIGCAAPEAPEQPPDAVDIPVQAVIEEPVEEKAAPSDLEVKLTNDGFETKEVKVAPGSRITIINEAMTIHKLTGGDFFKEQFNTHLKSVYGSADPLERNKLKISVVSVGEYEVQDLTTRDILKIISE